MDVNSVLEVSRQGMNVAFQVLLPILAAALVIGVAVSVFQAVTQVQEMTLTFVPKLLAVAGVMVVGGSWMLATIVDFARFCLEAATRLNP